MTTIICKPIDTWPGERRRPAQQQRSPFSSGWGSTRELLERELAHLGASDIILELDVADGDLRLDGWPRAHVSVPPAVKLSFTSREHGPMVYATDRYTHWHDNVRAIALGLEALRKIDRYGITDYGQQYAGWKSLEAGSSTSPTTREEAAIELARFATGMEPTAETGRVGAARSDRVVQAGPDHGAPRQWRRSRDVHPVARAVGGAAVTATKGWLNMAPCATAETRQADHANGASCTVVRTWTDNGRTWLVVVLDGEHPSNERHIDPKVFVRAGGAPDDAAR